MAAVVPLPGLQPDGRLVADRCLHHPGTGMCSFCLPVLLAAAVDDVLRQRAAPAAPSAEELAGEGLPIAVRVPQAARLLGLGTSKTWELVGTGEVPSIRFGGARLVPVRELVELVSRMAVEAADDRRPAAGGPR